MLTKYQEKVLYYIVAEMGRPNAELLFSLRSESLPFDSNEFCYAVEAITKAGFIKTNFDAMGNPIIFLLPSAFAYEKIKEDIASAHQQELKLEFIKGFLNKFGNLTANFCWWLFGALCGYLLRFFQ